MIISHLCHLLIEHRLLLILAECKQAKLRWGTGWKKQGTKEEERGGRIWVNIYEAFIWLTLSRIFMFFIKCTSYHTLDYRAKILSPWASTGMYFLTHDSGIRNDFLWLRDVSRCDISRGLKDISVIGVPLYAFTTQWEKYTLIDLLIQGGWEIHGADLILTCSLSQTQSRSANPQLT